MAKSYGIKYNMAKTYLFTIQNKNRFWITKIQSQKFIKHVLSKDKGNECIIISEKVKKLILKSQKDNYYFSYTYSFEKFDNKSYKQYYFRGEL